MAHLQRETRGTCLGGEGVGMGMGIGMRVRTFTLRLRACTFNLSCSQVSGGCLWLWMCSAATACACFLNAPLSQTHLFLDCMCILHRHPSDTNKVLPPFLVINKTADFPGGYGNVCAVWGQLFSQVDSFCNPCAWFLMPRSRHS